MIDSPVNTPLNPYPQSQTPHLPSRLRWNVWAQWMGANAVAEALGLGSILLIGMLVFVWMEPRAGPVLPVLLAILLGACVEGSIVGTAQWLVLRRVLSRLTWRTWATATAIGAGIAWTLGMLTNTGLALVMPDAGVGGETASVAQEPSGWVIYGAAVGLGLLAGTILAVAQWRALRHHVPKAELWLPANACAWAVGMALIFVGTNFIPASGVTLGSALLLVLWVILAGAAVGAIHGLALVWLLRERDRLEYAQASVAGSQTSPVVIDAMR
jgi:hypothetical protein